MFFFQLLLQRFHTFFKRLIQAYSLNNCRTFLEKYVEIISSRNFSLDYSNWCNRNSLTDSSKIFSRTFSKKNLSRRITNGFNSYPRPLTRIFHVVVHINHPRPSRYILKVHTRNLTRISTQILSKFSKRMFERKSSRDSATNYS